MSNNARKSCAACKYRRRGCSPDCPLLPYFPHDSPHFDNVRKLFKVKILEKYAMTTEIDQSIKNDAFVSLIYEANIRAKSPVFGCVGLVDHLSTQLEQVNEELEMVNLYLEFHRRRERAYQQRGMMEGNQIQDQWDHNVLMQDEVSFQNRNLEGNFVNREALFDKIYSLQSPKSLNTNREGLITLDSPVLVQESPEFAILGNHENVDDIDADGLGLGLNNPFFLQENPEFAILGNHANVDDIDADGLGLGLGLGLNNPFFLQDNPELAIAGNNAYVETNVHNQQNLEMLHKFSEGQKGNLADREKLVENLLHAQQNPELANPGIHASVHIVQNRRNVMEEQSYNNVGYLNSNRVIQETIPELATAGNYANVEKQQSLMDEQNYNRGDLDAGVNFQNRQSLTEEQNHSIRGGLNMNNNRVTQEVNPEVANAGNANVEKVQYDEDGDEPLLYI
ncbi:hypothetical protein ACFE04_013024 [Oxalis oulophora]